MMNSSSAERDVVVSLRGLEVVRGGNRVLRGIDMDIPAGQIVGLLGPSGCGKTTLMRAIVGVQTIQSGEVCVLGHATGDSRLRGRIGYVTQQPSVYVDLSLRANLEYHCRLMGADPRSVGENAERVGLGDLLDRRVSAMSGGQAGRASLACALVGDPELLILDEPTVGLDPLTREQLWSTFRRLVDSGSTLVISSHVMDEALRCDRLVLMRRGRILAVTTPGDLLASTGERNPDQAFLALVRADEEASR